MNDRAAFCWAARARQLKPQCSMHPWCGSAVMLAVKGQPMCSPARTAVLLAVLRCWSLHAPQAPAQAPAKLWGCCQAARQCRHARRTGRPHHPPAHSSNSERCKSHTQCHTWPCCILPGLCFVVRPACSYGSELHSRCTPLITMELPWQLSDPRA